MVDFLFALIASLATFYAQHLGLNAVLASALAVLPFCLLARLRPAFNPACASAFAGTFAGMTAPTLLTALWHPLWPAVLISVCAGLAIVAVKQAAQSWPRLLFNGHGGRLGFAALLGVITGLALSAFVSAHLFNKEYIPFPDYAPLLPPLTAVGMVLLAALGSVLPRLLFGPALFGFTVAARVMVSAVLGLAAGLVWLALPTMPALWPAAFYAGTFAAMSSSAVLPTRRALLCAGAATGVVLLLLLPWFGGLGGLLGLSAFIACILYGRLSLLLKPAA